MLSVTISLGTPPSVSNASSRNEKSISCVLESETLYTLNLEYESNSAGSPVALTFEYGLVNDFLSEWCEMKTKLNSGEISPNEYFEWKITWPQA